MALLAYYAILLAKSAMVQQMLIVRFVLLVTIKQISPNVARALLDAKIVPSIQLTSV